MKKFFPLGVWCASALLIGMDSNEPANPTERAARCSKGVSVGYRRDTSTLMLATAKSDTVFAGGEASVLSSSTLSGIRLGLARRIFADSVLLMTRNLRAFGQIMIADSFVGPGSDRVVAAFARSGSREIVVIPWSYAANCEPYFWYGSARFATPDQQGVYFLQLRPDSLWVERRPTFDALDAQLYSYAPGTSIPGPGRQFARLTPAPGAATEPRDLFVIYTKLPRSPDDTLSERLLREWLRNNPDSRSTYPASLLLSRWAQGISPN